jgi:hypothetical protein
MSDIDVKVGIQVAGDASGAQQVDGAIKQVGQTAQEVSRQTADAAQKSTEAAGAAAQKAVADAGTVSDGAGDAIQKTKASVEDLKKVVETPAPSGGLKDEVKGLADSIDTLSPDKAKGSINGLTQAVLGLASGNTTQGLEGLARSLGDLAALIPMPGVEILVGVAVAGIVGAWKILKDDAGETSRALNEFGDTVEAEMVYLEEWANAQINFTNLQKAISTVKGEFESAKKVTDAFAKSALAALNVKTSGETSDLRQQADSARASGDEASAMAYEEEAKRKELIAQIAQEKFELDELEGQIQLQKESIKLQVEALNDLKSKNREIIESFETLKGKSVEWTGNVDAAFGGEPTKKLVAAIQAEIAAREKAMKSVEFVDSQRHPLSRPLSDQDTLVGIGNVGKIKDAFSEIPSLRELADNLKLAEERAAAYNAAVEQEKNGYQDKLQALKDEAIALQSLMGQRIASANEYAAAIAGVDASVVATANQTADAMTQMVARGAAALEAAAESGSGLIEAVETYGAELSKISGDSAGAIGKGNEAIRSAVEGTGQEALAAGGEIKAGAEQFRQQLGDVLSTWRPAVEGLVSTGRQTLDMVSGLAAAQAELARQLSATRDSLGIVQSQIRNME